MTTNLRVGDMFPDFELPDHRKRSRRLSEYTRPSPLDEKLSFDDGYPVILVFGRGFFCPRDQKQMRGLVRFQSELAVNYCKLVTVSTDPPMVGAAFRAGLGAQWPFLSDEACEVIRRINILDETEGEYARTAQPYTFVLRPLTLRSTGSTTAGSSAAGPRSKSSGATCGRSWRPGRTTATKRTTRPR
jgi:peroxiredoxin